MRSAVFFRRYGARGASLLLVSTTLIACNAILENEPGRLRGTDQTAIEPGAKPALTQAVHDAGAPSGSAPDASVVADPSLPDAGRDGSCGPGTKRCGDACVSPLDPSYGCAATTCTPCAVPNAVAGCSQAGACVTSACLPGFADCNANADDGCETSLSSAKSCGACGSSCAERPNAMPACSGGTCSSTCNAGFGDCNGDNADGCETDLTNDRENCGACGHRCRWGACVAGACQRWHHD
jgi:hypothetical protein